MKKLTLFLAAAMITGAAFAGDGKSCCKKDGDKNAKGCCKKEASAKACCKKDGEKTAKAEDTKTTTASSSTTGSRATNKGK